jgi:hypothetical protein
MASHPHDLNIDTVRCNRNKKERAKLPSSVQKNWKLCYTCALSPRKVRIPVNLSKIIVKPTEAMQHIKTYVKDVYEQSVHYNRDERRGNMVDKHQAHLAATLTKETSEYILNTSMDQLSAMKNNLLSVTSTLPESTTRPELQLELLFGIGATLFSLYNYINTQSDTAQITRNKNSIRNLTHIAEIQEDHLKHLEIEIATNRYFYLQNLKFNAALLVSATQDITMQANTISNKFLNTIQQLQLKRLSLDFLQGTTIKQLFTHLQNIAHQGNMDLLISAPSDLFQIDVLFFYKSNTNELNIFLNVPMVNPSKLLKFFQFINFSISYN